MPLPAALRVMVEEYEGLAAHSAPSPASAPDARLRDLEYTLCVSTGTRDITDALETARSYLMASRAEAPASAGAPDLEPTHRSSSPPRRVSRAVRAGRGPRVDDNPVAECDDASTPQHADPLDEPVTGTGEKTVHDRCDHSWRLWATSSTSRKRDARPPIGKPRTRHARLLRRLSHANCRGS
ncbi:DUF5133 domain-containing protein [Streptomyces sp. NPDC048489]|uniref:DUF5133 domain-containing protein n=1 Tax=Streptomyces sp. NPDC048489 TaxID=3154504 RepID=UPI00343F83BA